MLHRRGFDAALTLGNKKAVDIFIYKENGKSISLDVKGVAKRYDWPVDNVKVLNNRNHFFALVCFENKIDDPEHVPSVWIIPSPELKPFIKKYKTRVVVSRALINNNGGKYKFAWDLLAD
jgi:hypothetical protein